METFEYKPQKQKEKNAVQGWLARLSRAVFLFRSGSYALAILPDLPVRLMILLDTFLLKKSIRKSHVNDASGGCANDNPGTGYC